MEAVVQHDDVLVLDWPSRLMHYYPDPGAQQARSWRVTNQGPRPRRGRFRSAAFLLRAVGAQLFRVPLQAVFGHLLFPDRLEPAQAFLIW